LLGRAEQSSPKAAQRRAEGAGLDGEGADRAIIRIAAMSDTVREIEYQFLQLDARKAPAGVCRKREP